MILIAILGIGFLIFFHELGHFLACRLTRTRTETFSVGFGPRLFGWENLPGERRRFTTGRRRLDPAARAMDFRISAIPLGGYVKMAGENPGEKSGRPDEFGSKSVLARVFIVSAGVLMNVIAAFAFYLVAYGTGLTAPPPVVGGVRSGGPAWAADLRSGDRIVSVGDAPLRSFSDLQMEAALLSAGERTTVVYRRGERESSAQVVPWYDPDRGALFLGVEAPSRLELAVDGKRLSIGPGERATVAGLPVLGEVEAVETLGSALAAGVDPIRVVQGDEAIEIRLADRALEAATDDWKIGVEPYGPAVVAAVRGAAEGKLQVGDRIVRATLGDGTEVPIASQSAWSGLEHAPSLRALEVRRGPEEHVVEVGADGPEAVAAFVRDVHAQVEATARVHPNEPSRANALSLDGRIARYERPDAARSAGMRSGDQIVKIGDESVATFADIQRVLRGVRSGNDLAIWVRGAEGADAAERKVVVRPTRIVPYAGIELSRKVLEEVVVPEGFAASIPVAVRRTGREIKNVFRTIGSFVTGSLSFDKNIGGPVALVTMSGRAAESSWQTFLLFLAYISVTLAVLNILPIPVLDGGHLLFILLEKLKGAPLKESTIAKFQMVGLVLILVLLGFALKNDIRMMFRS